ncbi:MAG: protease modulator HflC [Alphaproteobacteria bacterium]
MNSTKLVALAVLGAVILIALSTALYTVRETDQVLVRRFGEPLRVVTEPGLHFKIPLLDNATYFDRRLLDFDGDEQEIPTIDQKQMIVNAFARYKITNPLRFFQSVGSEAGMNARLPNIINSALRQVLGDVQLARVLTAERAVLMKQITGIASENADQFGIEIVDVRMKRVDLPPENSQAVFNRMRTQREQEAKLFRAEGQKESDRIKAQADKERRVIVADANKQSEILQGEGEAQAQAIYNDAYGQDPDFFDFWRSMQAMQKGLSSDTTTYVGPPDSDFFRYFSNETGQDPLDKD